MPVTFTPDQKACQVSTDLLREILEFLDDYSDAEYTDSGPRGNRAMSLFCELQRETGIE